MNRVRLYNFSTLLWDTFEGDFERDGEFAFDFPADDYVDELGNVNMVVERMVNGQWSVASSLTNVEMYEAEATGAYIKMDKDGLFAYDGTQATAIIDNLGNVTITGTINALSGDIANWKINGSSIETEDGSIKIDSSLKSIIIKTAENDEAVKLSATGGLAAVQGSIAGWTIDSTSIKKNNIILNSSTEQITVGSHIIIDGATGKLTADNVDLSGKITAGSGKIGSWIIKDGGIVDSESNPKMTISTTMIQVSDQVKIGLYDGANYGIYAGGNILNASGITAKLGTIGGINITDTKLFSANGNFTLHNTGIIEAKEVNIEGSVNALSGKFGSGSGAINAGADGIWAGLAVGDPNSTFWISSKEEFQDPRYPGDPTKKIMPGDAYFKGSVEVSRDSVMSGGNFAISNGSIIAGIRNGAHVRLEYLGDAETGGGIYSQNENHEEIFRINNLGAYIKGDITAISGSILGNLSVGASHTVYLDGNSSAIFLYDETGENTNRVVRLNNLGLYTSENGGITYSPALTGTGINANAINDGVLTISDSGHGASGISIRQWSDTLSEYVENVNINPSGINVLNGAITVFSDQTGEVLIGGGYLRVKGLDMGVVTSNNFIGNGTFSMISDKFGILQKNQGEVFLGRAQSSGGAVSNPTYHYAGWPDFGSRHPHTVWTYNVNPDGTINDFDPDLITDSNKGTGNYPNIARVSFNPQWSSYHPIYEYCVVPNDACNFVTIIDKNGSVVRNLKAWKGGLFGSAFTPDGSKLVVCGDDIDRKRAPWDMVVFDSSSSDPDNWHVIGVIPVGEFPSKVVCDNSGYAYCTVSLDNTIYKLDIVNMRVVSIMTLTDVRGIPVIPMPIAISNDYSKIYVGGVVSDYVYEIPTSFTTPFVACRKFSVIPYPGNRGIIHDIKVLPNGNISTSSASTTDSCITIINAATGEIMTYIDANSTGRLAIPPDATEEEIANWNFYSSTSLCPHPALPFIYVTVTNRCMMSVLDYSSGQLTEISRVATGSNCSGLSISNDATKIYVPNHHYHTYPLGANKIWGYDAETNYYVNDDVFDTTQKYWHHNPAGMIMTGDRYLWVANRATNRIAIIDTQNWAATWTYIENVGNKPYELMLNNAQTKVFVSNDDSTDDYDPDYITIIDAGTKTIDGIIHVADRPFGIQISPDDKTLYVACYDSKMVQKADIQKKIITGSAKLEGNPKHIKLVGNKLYATCMSNDTMYCIDADTLGIISSIPCDNDPAQMVGVGTKLYVTNQGADNVMVIDTVTNTVEERISVGSRPKPIAYNSAKNLIYVGNSGEGSVCIIDTSTNTVKEWCMTGDNPEYICVSGDGSKWYVTAHGPEDICSYGTGTPYIGDAYLDNEGGTHKYGASYWMPSRSKWTRGSDNTLTSFSSVEFWPTSKLQGKQGYAHLTVMGMYDAFAKLEQDVYPLVNYSDGSCEYTTEIIDIQEGIPKELQNDIADFRNIPGLEKRVAKVVSATDTSVVYTEDAHYSVNYENNTISLIGTTIPPSRVRSNTQAMNGETPVQLIAGAAKYNTIYVYPLNQTEGKFEEGTDYIIDMEASPPTIKRTPDSSIESGSSVTVEYRHYLKVRYYYLPNKRNYSDVVLSSDMFWRWPRPENQWVRMELDELVPKFIYVDNDNIDPWSPSFDFGKPQIDGQGEFYYNSKGEKIRDVPIYKGIRYSSNTNRGAIAAFTSSSAPASGNLDTLKTGSADVTLGTGLQSITADAGSGYYVNEIIVTHATDGRMINDAKVEISIDGQTWETVYDEVLSTCQYTVSFQKPYSTPYNGSKRVRFVRVSSNGSSKGADNTFRQLKIMGDWKINKSYTFSSNTVWDSEGRREVYLVLNGQDKIRFDIPGATINPSDVLTPPAQRVRYRLYYTDENNDKIIRGDIQMCNLYTDTVYTGLRIDETPSQGVTYDYIWDHINNTVQRTVESTISDGEEVRIVYRFVQENLSNLPLCVAYRKPDTGNTDASVPASVAETDATGAWVEWEFENEYRCDWYIGWIADIGLGTVNIYLDDQLTHSLSQSAAKVERFSQLSQDLLPGKHKIRLVQQQGRVNFDVIKLEDMQLYNINSSLVASPSTNPVELFTWYPTKISPGKARRYLGRGTQVTSGAYDTPRVDKITSIPNNQIPVKYRVRFQTTLEGRGEPVDNEGSYGGEAVGNEFKFERGSVLITDVTMEKGVNPTYWRMAPAEDKYPGLSIEYWDKLNPNTTGIQNFHLADGSVDGEKIKAFSVTDIHIASDASIQESKLSLNYPTHPHINKSVLDQIAGFGSSGTSTLIARADHTHTELASGSFTGNVTVGGSLTVNGGIKEIGRYEIVHRRPLYGLAGDIQFQTNSSTWEVLTNHYDIFHYGMPAVAQGAVRYYRLYAVYGDNIIDSDAVRARIRIFGASQIYEWKLTPTWGDANGKADDYSNYFQVPDEAQNHSIQVRIQNNVATYSDTDKEVGITWLELIAYDVYEE